MPFQSGDVSPAHILLVEDHAEFRNLLQDVLHLMGYSVSTAESGEKALDILTTQATKLDIIICDFNLLDMTANELLRILYTEKNINRIPFIVITGDANLQQLCPEHHSNIDAYLVKPFPLSHLREVTERILHSELV